MIQNNVQRVGPDLADAAVVGALNHTLGDNVPQGDAVPQGKGPALADMDLDRIRDIKRDCSTCINLLEQIGRERR